MIKNNLYTSATEVGIEPNIIVEFARIFGFGSVKYMAFLYIGKVI